MNDPASSRPQEERDAVAIDRDRPPDGFRIYWSNSPFSSQHGPYYQKFEGARSFRGFRAARRHCNSAGIVHGGMLVSFVDALMGVAVWRRAKAMPLTVRLNTDFVSIARPGDWIEGVAEVTDADGELLFVTAQLSAGARVVLAARGVFAKMQRHASEPR